MAGKGRLGLPWIPPTLREDRGEVEAALEGHLPDLVEVADIVNDLHMHTDLTDGLADLDDIVAAVARHGYRYCAITDHAPLLAMQRMTRDKALRQRSELPELARRRGITVLHGSELNIAADGSLDWDDDFLAGFDVLVASVHSDFGQTREEMTRRLLTAIEHPYVNIIGHPTTRLLGRVRPLTSTSMPCSPLSRAPISPWKSTASPIGWTSTTNWCAAPENTASSSLIDTDAHAVPHLDYISYGVAVAQRGWVSADEVLNTWPLDRFRSSSQRDTADLPLAGDRR